MMNSATAAAATAATAKILDLIIVGGGLSGVMVAHEVDARQPANPRIPFVEVLATHHTRTT